MTEKRRKYADEVEERNTRSFDKVEERSDELKSAAEKSIENEIDIENEKSEVGIEKAMCQTDVCEVHDARQPSVSGKRVLRGDEKRQRWDDVPQHTE